jgi:SAM-dependent methyltransferase
MTISRDSEAWDRRYAGSELVWTAQPNRFLVSEAAGLAPGRALDVACGEGRNAVWLAEQGWRATGVDFSEVALGKARALAESRGVEVGWVRADVVTHRAEEQAYDLVIVFYLQLREEARRQALRAAADAVAVGGTLLLVAHDSSNLTEGYGGPQSPAVLYAGADVAADLDGSGLVIEQAGVVQRPVETPEGERIALDVLVRAHRPTLA